MAYLAPEALATIGYFTFKLCNELCRAWFDTLHTDPCRLRGKQGRLSCDRSMVCAEQLLIKAMHCVLWLGVHRVVARGAPRCRSPRALQKT